MITMDIIMINTTIVSNNAHRKYERFIQNEV